MGFWDVVTAVITAQIIIGVVGFIIQLLLRWR